MHPFTREDLDRFFKPTFNYQVQRFPLTDLMIDNDTDDIVVRVAVAGFSKEEVQIEQSGNQLHIRGKKKDPRSYDEKYTYVQKQLSTDSSFERIIVLHEKYVSGKVSASLHDGILTVTVVPQEQEKNLISID